MREGRAYAIQHLGPLASRGSAREIGAEGEEGKGKRSTGTTGRLGG